MGIMELVFGDLNKKEVKKLEKIADKVMALDEEMQKLTDDELRAKTEEFKDRCQNKGESLDSLLPEAFAVCREGASRTLGMKHFKVQVIGGIALHQGRIAEMRTGEGKTLVATLPAYLNALEGKGVYVVTVNDYLAKRDMEWMGKLYTFLGLTVGGIFHSVPAEKRKHEYLCDITYGTNNEFGFDYLRDNMVSYKEQMVQRDLNYAIVDEVDSILIDEARTPLIISGMGEKSTDLYTKADRFVKNFKLDEDFTMDEKDKTVSLTEEGVSRCEDYFGVENFSDPENMELNHHVIQALKANFLMKRDVDYVAQDGEILIVDEFTGRIMQGRRYSNGLHQAIEAKEGMNVRSESKTLATITLQNYFRMFNKLSGMTGTAKTEEDEFRDIYNMDVVVIPTNKPVRRTDLDDSVYLNEPAKFRAIVNEIAEVHETGRPVLVGTISIEKSEAISDLLKKRGIKHNVLNAKHHEREAEIVAEAGRLGAVTIATNMAGRGTDIILGGNPEFEAKKEMRKLGYDENTISYASSRIPLEDEELLAARKVFDELHDKYKAERAEEQEKVRELGGLHIIGTERHESRRIDNQLRGRAGRQGDPGSTKFFIGLDDDLMRLFGGERIQAMMARFNGSEDEPIEAKPLTRAIENAQKKVEGRNFTSRKYVLQYDNVMNKQREIIYGERRRVLDGEDLKGHILSMADEFADAYIDTCTAESKFSEEWNLPDLEKSIKKLCNAFTLPDYGDDPDVTPEQLHEDVHAEIAKLYDEKEAEIGEERMRELERMILIRVVDNKWMDHIDAMDQLRTGIGLRGLGHQDPAQAYAQEGFDMFEEMISNIKEDTVKFCFNVTVQTNTERVQVMEAGNAQKEDVAPSVGGGALQHQQRGGQAMPSAAPKETKQAPKVPIKREAPKVGRNDPCPCGSGKKYKNCCGKNEQ
ncbi:MAG: preprotein translocase subunit SecA [Anaerovoracaceae bacterium]|nr:preprotein translocase subunit SecA [Bacillota bacterium]MDY5905830.1 preprotein translocase subunit SecA [Anaerovoracaceae bacterium]